MKLYVYQILLKPAYHDFSAWDDKVKETFDQHGEFLNRGIRHGRVLMVGRTDTDLKDNFGLVLFEAANQEDAEAFMNEDPAVARGIMVGRAFPFKLLKVTEQAKKYNTW